MLGQPWENKKTSKSTPTRIARIFVLPPHPEDPNNAENISQPMDADSTDAQHDDMDFRDDMVAIVDMLQTLGVDAANATRYAMSVVNHARSASGDPKTTFVGLMAGETSCVWLATT